MLCMTFTGHGPPANCACERDAQVVVGSCGELWGAVAQWSEHKQLKQQALGSIPGSCPGFFFFFFFFSLSAGLY